MQSGERNGSSRGLKPAQEEGVSLELGKFQSVLQPVREFSIAAGFFPGIFIHVVS